MLAMLVSLVSATRNIIWNPEFGYGSSSWGENVTGPWGGDTYWCWGDSYINGATRKVYQTCYHHGPPVTGGYANTWVGQGYHIWSYPHTYYGRHMDMVNLMDFRKVEGSSKRTSYGKYEWDGTAKYYANFWGQTYDGQGTGVYNFKYMEIFLVFDFNGITEPLYPQGCVIMEPWFEGEHSRYAVMVRSDWEIGTDFTYWNMTPWQWDYLRWQCWTYGFDPAEFGIYGMCGLGVEVHNAYYAGQTDYINVIVN